MSTHWKFLRKKKSSTLGVHKSLPESFYYLCPGTGQQITLGWRGVQLVHQLHRTLWGRLQRGVKAVLCIVYTQIQQISQALSLPVFHSKTESNDMQDLVQMMTQTLRMDTRDVLCDQEGSRCNTAKLPEFKLNRKYRDTLMLHGKSGQEEGDFHLADFRSGWSHKMSF